MDEHNGGTGGVEAAKNMFEKFPNLTMVSRWPCVALT
jgi:hypothetical protein